MNYQNREGWLYVLPLLFWLALSICIPLYIAIELSFFNVKIIGTEGEFVGLKNYFKIFTSSKFHKAFSNSILWVLANAITQTFFAFLIALTLNKNFKGVKIATNWIILSFIIPTVVIVVIWKLMLSSSSGIINSLLIQIQIIDKPIGFFSSSTSAFISLVLINSWRWSPFLALIILSGLKSINKEIYDASKIDGASFFSEFFYITLPQLKGILFVLGLVGTLLSFNVFDIIWLITKGGPSSATTTLPLLIYETAFTKFRLSQAAALSVVTSFILLSFSIIFIKFMGKEDE
jgi:multiple sugar transport system permease protein